MLKSLIDYSAVHTKAAAMLARHLSQQQYAELAAKPTVADACTYLKNNTVYASLFKGYNERNLHRGDIERLLEGYMQSEIQKIYHFSSLSVRKMLSYTVVRYEIELLKLALRGVLTADFIPLPYDRESFFVSKLSFDIQRLAQAQTARDYLAALEGSAYHRVLSSALSQAHIDLFTCEMLLDNYYFKYAWKLKDKALSGKDREIVSESLGGEIDMLNLMWIYRCKKYYQLDSELIYSDIIPIYYKIPRQKLGALIRTADLNAYLRAVKQTPYDALFGDLDNRFIEQNYSDLVLRRSRRLVKKYPFSIASVIGYLHGLEVEIHNITTIIESIRYGTSAFYPI